MGMKPLVARVFYLVLDYYLILVQTDRVYIPDFGIIYP